MNVLTILNRDRIKKKTTVIRKIDKNISIPNFQKYIILQQ